MGLSKRVALLGIRICAVLITAKDRICASRWQRLLALHGETLFVDGCSGRPSSPDRQITCTLYRWFSKYDSGTGALSILWKNMEEMQILGPLHSALKQSLHESDVPYSLRTYTFSLRNFCSFLLFLNRVDSQKIRTSLTQVTGSSEP